MQQVDIVINTLNKCLVHISHERRRDILYDVLSHDYQLVNMNQFAKLKRKYVSGYNTHNNSKNNATNLLINDYMPIPVGFDLNYLGNKKTVIFELRDHFPKGKDVGLIKPIGPGEIYNDVLYLYNDIENIIKVHNSCVTETLFFYVSWGSEETYNSVSKDVGDYKIINDELSTTPRTKTKKDAFIISEYNYKKKHLIQENQQATFPMYLRNIYIALSSLKKGGTLYIESNYFASLPFVQLLFYVSKLFSTKEFVKGEINNNMISGGFFIFRGYKDPVNGLNVLKRVLRKIEMNQEVVKSIYEKEVDKQFIAWLEAIYERMKTHFIEVWRRRQFIKSALENKDVKKYQLDKFVNQQIEIGKRWCKENGIAINEVYNKPIDMKMVYYLFPKEKGVDMNKLCLTNDAIYSVSKPKEAKYISEFIRKRFPNAKTIVDACANVGGNTINFAKHFDKVISIEIDPETHSCLKNNVEVYNRDNVVPILGDYVVLKKKIDAVADIVFFDPPWTGIFYKMEKTIDMYLSGVDMVDLLPNSFVMKAPYNYNVEKLRKKFPLMEVEKVGNYLVISHVKR